MTAILKSISEQCHLKWACILSNVHSIKYEFNEQFLLHEELTMAYCSNIQEYMLPLKKPKLIDPGSSSDLIMYVSSCVWEYDPMLLRLLVLLSLVELSLLTSDLLRSYEELCGI